MAKRLVAQGVKGVIFQPVEFSSDRARANAEVVKILESARIPIVLIDCDIVHSPDWGGKDLVALDNFAAGRELAFLLKERRVGRVAFVARNGCADSVRLRLSGVESVFGEGCVDRVFKVRGSTDIFRAG